MRKSKNPKLTLQDKLKHRCIITPLLVTEVMLNSNRNDLSPLAMVKLIKARMDQCDKRWEKTFGDKKYVSR